MTSGKLLPLGRCRDRRAIVQEPGGRTAMAVGHEEHAEHAEHAAHSGNKTAALLIAILAAALAICEQQAKHAEISVEANAILAADTWNEYQAKSVRSAMAQDLERVTATLDVPADPERAAQRDAALKRLRSDREHYDTDPKTGKDALAANARGFEAIRDHEVEKSHTYDNAAAALELGIVLSTASVITSSKMLLRFAFVLGAVGAVLGIFGAVAPEMVVF
jgi:hypothetical protein